MAARTLWVALGGQPLPLLVEPILSSHLRIVTSSPTRSRANAHPAVVSKKRGFLLPHPSSLCVIWGEGGSDPRSVVMASETVFEIERNRAMKTSRTIKSRAGLSSTRCGRAYAIARLRVVGLLLAGVMWPAAPTARAENSFCALNALSGPCDPSPLGQQSVMNIPGIASDLVISPQNGHPRRDVFHEKPIAGTATLTAQVESLFWEPGARFAVQLEMSGRVGWGEPGVHGNFLLDPACALDPGSWNFYSAISGTMVGLPGSTYDTAVYSITLQDGEFVQVGAGANNRNLQPGVYAPIVVEAVGPLPDPSLPTGPMTGELTIVLADGCYPPLTPDVTGTWTGSIDCAGFALDIDDETPPTEQHFSNVTLKFGSQQAFTGYTVEITGGNTINVLCANLSNDPNSTTKGQGTLFNPSYEANPLALQVFLKAEVFPPNLSGHSGKLRARQIVGNTTEAQLCKWSFVRVDTADPQIADACTP